MSIASTSAEEARPDDNGAAADAQYVLGPDSLRHADTPQGALQELKLPNSRVYPGYTHKAMLYIPANYDGKSALPVMFFQDGSGFADLNGPFRTPIVLDNLIYAKATPKMAAVFIDPGRAIADDGLGSSQRSLEYDTLNGDFARFLLTEVLPEVRKVVTITDDPQGRGLGGQSSGGICAFTAAWQNPDAFTKVFSANGSFVDIRGGGAYPDLIRAEPRKKLRIFMQDGVHDRLGGPFSGLDWTAGSRAMARALAFKGYDFQFIMGNGTHSPNHAASIFPAALRWLWRDYPR